jgi:hypothetical protein
MQTFCVFLETAECPYWCCFVVLSICYTNNYLVSQNSHPRCMNCYYVTLSIVVLHVVSHVISSLSRVIFRRVAEQELDKRKVETVMYSSASFLELVTPRVGDIESKLIEFLSVFLTCKLQARNESFLRYHGGRKNGLHIRNLCA